MLLGCGRGWNAGCLAELFDQGLVSSCFAVPAASDGVLGEQGGVFALCSKDGQVAVFGAEAGAMFTNIGIGAGFLRWGAEAVAAGEAGFDGRCFTPVAAGDTRDGQLGSSRSGRGADAGFGQVQGSLVLGTHGGIKEGGVAQAHLG